MSKKKRTKIVVPREYVHTTLSAKIGKERGIKFGTLSTLCSQYGLKLKLSGDIARISGDRVRLMKVMECIYQAQIPYQLEKS